jgi:hypothetical protein
MAICKVGILSFILICGMGNVVLEASSGSKRTVNQFVKFPKAPSASDEKEPRKRRSEAMFSIDPLTGIEYREFTRIREGKIENVVEQKCPDGKTMLWVKCLPGTKVAFPDEALAKALEREELYDSIKGSIIQAIRSKSLEGLERMLQVCKEPETFIAQYPQLLQEVYHHFDRMDADEEFREAVTNILLAFGYPSLID